MEKLRVAVSRTWFDLLASGKAGMIYKEVRPEWVEVFTTCNPDEKRPDVLYANMRDPAVVTLYVPLSGQELDMEAECYDIYSGSQLGIGDGNYFVVLFK